MSRNPIRSARFCNLRQHVRSGYTLLELILALALSVLVISMITMAINVYLVNLNRQQTTIEQKQLVRSVMRMIASDIRAGLQYKAIDVSGIENLQASQSLIAGILATQGTDPNLADAAAGLAGGLTGGAGANAGGGASTGTTGGAGGTGGSGAGSGSSSSGGTPSTSSSATEDEPAEEEVSYRPTLVGNETILNIDISRLPRLDQYHSLLTGGDLSSQTGSDVKAINYLVSSSPAPGQQTEFEPEVANLGGLYRRQIDRAVADFRGEIIAPSSPDEYSQLLAPEIVEIRFRYFDGSDWTSSWDSEEQGGFPLAIEVTIVLDPQRVKDAISGAQRSLSVRDLLRMETYRTVVHLPCAEAPAEASE
jgi:type II secretory pathway pseudopilin PulG